MATESEEHIRGHRILTWRRIVSYLRSEGIAPTLENIIQIGMEANLKQESDAQQYDYTGGTDNGRRAFEAVKTNHLRNVLEENQGRWIRIDTEPDETCNGCQLKPTDLLHCYTDKTHTREKDIYAISELTRFTRRKGYDFREDSEVDKNTHEIKPILWLPTEALQGFVFREDSWF